ncbi:hypothetical protein BCD48_28490 [Pseudofrankia sp. BMG5.36]|nr:hypothetical protein BCD48_28490 [Pseudofrankia sp. BMG5.36]
MGATVVTATPARPALTAGWGHALAISTAASYQGRVLAWGCNEDGQLGDGYTTGNGVPSPAGYAAHRHRPGVGRFLAQRSAAQGRDGLDLGENYFGQLGYGKSGGISTYPHPLPLTGVRGVAAGPLFTLAIAPPQPLEGTSGKG